MSHTDGYKKHPSSEAAYLAEKGAGQGGTAGGYGLPLCPLGLPAGPY